MTKAEIGNIQLLIAPGIPARSNGSSDEAISFGTIADDQAVATRMA